MSNYIKMRVYLSDSQQAKFKSALKNHEGMSLQIDKSKPPNYEIYLTKTQIKQLRKNKKIKLSKTQLKKNGGLLPFLIPILTALSTGALSGSAAWGTKKALDKLTGNGILQNWEGRGKKNVEREFFRIGNIR